MTFSDRLLTVAQVREALQLGRSKVYELISNGALPSVRLGRAVRVRESDVRAFIEGNSRSARSTGGQPWS